MDIGLKEWLIIGGVLVIGLIIFDGWRRMQGQRNTLKMDIDRKLSDVSDDEYNPELPNGGARVKHYDETAEHHSAVFESHRRIDPVFEQVDELVSAPRAKSYDAEPVKDEIDDQPLMAEPEPSVNASEPAETPDVHSDYVYEVSAEHRELDPLFDDIPERHEPYFSEPMVASVEPYEPERVEPEAEQEPECANDYLLAPEVEIDPVLVRTDVELERYQEVEPAFEAEPESDVDVLAHSAEVAMPPSESEMVGSDTGDVPDSSSRPIMAEQEEDDRTVAGKPLAELLDLEQPITVLMKQVAERQREAAPVPQHDMFAVDDADDVPVVTEKTERKSRKRRSAQDDAVAETPAQDSLFEDPLLENARTDRKVRHKVSEPDEVLVITVVGKGKALQGQTLLQVVLACGMRFGDMALFHRFEDGLDQGAVQFSMANAVNPGTFDLEAMSNITTPGVSFFMTMSEPRDPKNAFECMLATAETVAKHLGGDLLDENRSVMRPQTKAHYRERIREFEMHKRSRRDH